MVIRLVTILGILVIVGGGFLFFRAPSLPSSETTILDVGGVKKSEVVVSEPPNPEPLDENSGNAGVESSLKPAIDVEKNNAVPLKIDCSGPTFEQIQCYRAYYQGLLQKEGSKAAMSDLRARYGDPFIHSQCHQLAHVIGREAALFYHQNLSEAFRYGDSFCWSGYYHGVMEGIVGDIGKENLVAKLDSICKDIPGKEKHSFDYYNCVHGLGHGIMATLGNELPASLKMCDNLTGGWERSSCWSGAFMENIIADEVYHVSKYLKDDDPLYPCNMVEDTYRNTCYLMQTSRMLALVGRDFSKVFELCSRVEEPYTNTCYQSLGRDASGNTVSNVEMTRKYCMLGRDFRQQSNCIIGAVKDFISFHHSDKEAKELCVSLPQELQETCSTTAENYYKLF